MLSSACCAATRAKRSIVADAVSQLGNSDDELEQLVSVVEFKDKIYALYKSAIQHVDASLVTPDWPHLQCEAGCQAPPACLHQGDAQPAAQQQRIQQLLHARQPPYSLLANPG